MSSEPEKNSFSGLLRKWWKWILFGIIIAYIIQFYVSKIKIPEISYTEFMEQVELANVKEVLSEGQQLTVTLKEPVDVLVEDSSWWPPDEKKPGKASVVLVIVPQGRQGFIMAKLQEKGVKISAIKPKGGGGGDWWIWLLMLLPLVLLWPLFRGMTGQMNQHKIFGRSKARLHQEVSKVTFGDFAGCDEAKEEMVEIIEFLKKPDKFRRLGAEIPKGVLLMGPPGTGKTLLARAVAGEANVPFFSIAGSEFVEMFVGVGASRVRDLFENAKKNAPCIVFIDEVDAVGRQRGAGVGGGNDEREQTLNQVLNEMDGFEANLGIIVIAATNRPDVLDPAFLRPGRFDRKIVVDAPDLNGRREIFKIHLQKTVHNISNEGLEKLARSTPGATGAHIKDYVNEGALFAARQEKNQVEVDDVEKAIEKVEMGPEKKGRIISVKEKEIIAYHEAGHALVSELLKDADKVRKVTIIPRGFSGGATWHMPEEDRTLMTEEQCRAALAVLVAGRVSEQKFLKVITTGAGSDIERATEISRKMVTSWGMSRAFGLITLGQRREHPFLGMEMGEVSSMSEETAKLRDSEIRNNVERACCEVERLLQRYSEALKDLAKTLLEKETLTGDEVRKIIEDNPSSD